MLNRLMLIFIALILQGCAPMAISSMKTARSLPRGANSAGASIGYHHASVDGPYHPSPGYPDYGQTTYGSYRELKLPTFTGTWRKGLPIPGSEFGVDLNILLLHLTADLKYQFLGFEKNQDLASAIDLEGDLSSDSVSGDIGIIVSHRLNLFDFHIELRGGYYNLFRDSNETPAFEVSTDITGKNYSGATTPIVAPFTPSTWYGDLLLGSDFYIGKKQVHKLRFVAATRLMSTPSKTYRTIASHESFYPRLEGYTFTYSPILTLTLSYFFEAGIPLPKTLIESNRICVNEAEKLMNERLYDQTILLLKSKIRGDLRKDARAWEIFGDAFYNKGEFQKALRAYDMSLSINPNNKKLEHTVDKMTVGQPPKLPQ